MVSQLWWSGVSVRQTQGDFDQDHGMISAFVCFHLNSRRLLWDGQTVPTYTQSWHTGEAHGVPIVVEWCQCAAHPGTL